MWERLANTYNAFFGPDVLVSPGYLLASIPLAWLIWRWRRGRGAGEARTGFWAWLAPREIWAHRSNLLDLQLFAIGRAMVLLGLFGRVTLTTLVAVWVAQAVASDGAGAAAPHPAVLALLLFLVADVTLYWLHRAYHRIGLIWPLHAVHHSAEVLTPFSAYRQHPVSLLVNTAMSSAIIGVVQGLLVGTLDPDTMMLQIAGVNTFAVAANLAMANFHHSHIWVSFGPVLERIVISPAQHQIHHSALPRHFDRNFGQTLALWDWMFGTLYIIRGPETLRLGLDAPEDAPLMTHDLGTVLISPLARIWRGLRGIRTSE